MKRSFLTYTAIIEGLTGLALIFAPSTVARLLFEADLNAPLEIVLALIGGAAIFTLALGCWLSRVDSALTAVILKMLLFYNVVIAIFLLYAIFSLGFKGPALWLIIAFHSFQAILGVVLMRKKDTL